MLLQLHNISKRFPGVLANDHISLSVEKGEIHAIVGENGAGKTTLMNILYGLQQPDEGEIRLNGQRVHLHSPANAIACGIGMVHQHFMLIPSLTVTENVMLGENKSPLPQPKTGILSRLHQYVRHALLDIQQAEQKVREISERFGLDVNPSAKINTLAVGVRQRVEIIKALYRDVKLLILDEPTSVLTPQETLDFFRILKTLVQQGMSVIFITHKLQEVIESSNRATVLRQGKVVDTVNVSEVTQRKLAQLMVGRGILEHLEKSPCKRGAEVLRVEQLSHHSADHFPIVNQVSFSIHRGEIFGIAGVSGNGQAELSEILAGLRQPSSGTISMNGTDITRKSPRFIIHSGVSHIPAERQAMGAVMDFPLDDNAILGTWFETPFSKNMLLDQRQSHDYAHNLVVTYEVKTRNIRVAFHDLSGGNQQKFVVGRELHRQPQLLLAVQPTRGVDIGSTEFIHQKLLEQREKGVAILLISTELDEIFALSDRIAVMYQGRIMGILPSETANRETVGLMMAGSQKDL